MASDSSKPEFWHTRYRDGVTPWDAGRVPPKLARWLQGETPGRRVLVPGCGSGYEVRAFAEQGDDVLGIDFFDAAIQMARRTLGELAGRVSKADFFTLDAPPFDLVCERSRWARRIAELVRGGAVLAGFFYFDDNRRGPPFGIAPEFLALLLDRFERVEDRPAAQSLQVFQGKERWQVWKRRL
ncbi:MAG: methyltransferase domain-containing protein [Betaproteobacteria bacterium]|nr:MAG: methyltransferase domain-containing protein [Betaproteobacteria bacterium]